MNKGDALENKTGSNQNTKSQDNDKRDNKNEPKLEKYNIYCEFSSDHCIDLDQLKAFFCLFVLFFCFLRRTSILVAYCKV